MGLAIIILGFKFSEKTRKVVETLGAIIFHVGVFGILYYKVSPNLFISLVLLVLSFFILIDPLKIGNYLNFKMYRLVGYFILFGAVVFSLDYFSHFPVWLWIIPIIIYLAPYLFTPLRAKLKYVMTLAWFVVLLYVGAIGYVMYAKYNPEAQTSNVYRTLAVVLPDLQIPDQNMPLLNKKYRPKPIIDPESTITPAPFSTSTPDETTTDTNTTTLPNTVPIPNTLPKPLAQNQNSNEQHLKLRQDINELLKKYDELTKENERLKRELNALKGQSETL